MADIKKEVAKYTNTHKSEWQFIDGPDTGVGVEYWLRNKKTEQEAYVCVDQNCVSIEVAERYD